MALLSVRATGIGADSGAAFGVDTGADACTGADIGACAGDGVDTGACANIFTGGGTWTGRRGCTGGMAVAPHTPFFLSLVATEKTPANSASSCRATSMACGEPHPPSHRRRPLSSAVEEELPVMG